MGRYHHQVYEKTAAPRYLAVFGLQWQIVEAQRLEPATDLYGAMTATIERLGVDGWEAESEARFGFTFIRRGVERRLLILAPRGPYDPRAQSFSPFSQSERL